MLSHKEATLTINLKAVANNYNILKNKANLADCASVVKANAYGLGVDKIAPALYEQGCRIFFVANLDEAIFLRKILTENDSKIYVFNGISDFLDIKAYQNNNLRTIINTKSQLQWFVNNNNSNVKYAIHIDTGMNRLGLDPDFWQENIKQIKKLNPDFLMSHLACADDNNHSLNNYQYQLFKEITEGFTCKLSLSNSYGIFNDNKMHFDIVRPGCALYGVNPTTDKANPMHNVVSLKTKILQIRKISSIKTIGYGATASLPKNSRIATIACGYADGYFRHLSNKGHCFFKSHKLPIIGRVSMDLISLDISHVPENEISENNEIELIGDNVTIDEIAKIAGTIAYEVLTNLGNRYKRIYI